MDLSRMIRQFFNAESKIRPVFRLLQGSEAKGDGAAGLQRPQGGVRQRQRVDPVAAAGLRHAAGGASTKWPSSTRYASAYRSRKKGSGLSPTIPSAPATATVLRAPNGR
jgi:hypothetical protein